MRVLNLRYPGPDEFLADYQRDMAGGGLLCHGDDKLDLGERVMLDISFPGLPNGVLIEGFVRWRRLPGSYRSNLPTGVGVEFLPRFQPRRDFLLAFAQGRLRPGMTLRKRERRVPARFRVEFRHEKGEFVTAFTRDVSVGGMFVLTRSVARRGSPVFMRLFAQLGARPIEVEGRVAWLEMGDPPGMGIRFVGLDGDGKGVLEALVARTAALVAQSGETDQAHW